MRGRKGTRTAAVVMAGLVSAALFAPGMAAASTTPSSSDSGGILNSPGDAIDGLFGGPSDAPSTEPSTGTSDPGGSISEFPLPSTPSLPSLPEVPVPGTDSLVPGTAPGSGSGETSSDGLSDVLPSQTGGTGDEYTGQTTGEGNGFSVSSDDVSASADEFRGSAARLFAARVADEDTGSTEGLEDAGLGALAEAPSQQFQDFFDSVFPDGAPEEGADPTQLQNPQQACALFGSQLGGLTGALGDSFASFCGQLPEEFGPGGLSDFTDLLGGLTDLLGGLIPSGGGTDQTGSVIETQYVPVQAYAAPYFNPGNTYNCGDLDYDTAQMVLGAHPTDVNRLDRDKDGVACERPTASKDCGCGTEDYDGYPVGAVATGDAPGTGRPGQAGAVALGLVMTAGIASGRPLTRRRERPELAGV